VLERSILRLLVLFPNVSGDRAARRKQTSFLPMSVRDYVPSGWSN
jgi:hypothetical protein